MNDLNYFPLFLSIKVAVLATLTSLVIGIPTAYYLSISKSRIGDIIDSLTNFPVILPPTVLGYYLLVLLGRQSPIGIFLEKNFDIMIVFTPIGAVIAASVVSVPYLIKSAKTSFCEIDSDLLNAGRVLGKNEAYIFLTIIIPLSWRGIIAGITMAFARALGDFGTTLMVAGSIPDKTLTMPIAIYNAMQADDTRTVNLLVAIMTFTALSVIFIISRIGKKRKTQNV